MLTAREYSGHVKSVAGEQLSGNERVDRLMDPEDAALLSALLPRAGSHPDLVKAKHPMLGEKANVFFVFPPHPLL